MKGQHWIAQIALVDAPSISSNPNDSKLVGWPVMHYQTQRAFQQWNLLDTLAWHFCWTLLTGHSYLTLLLDTPAGHSWHTWQDTPARHFCFDTRAGHCYRTLLLDTLAGHSLFRLPCLLRSRCAIILVLCEHCFALSTIACRCLCGLLHQKKTHTRDAPATPLHCTHAKCIMLRCSSNGRTRFYFLAELYLLFKMDWVCGEGFW